MMNSLEKVAQGFTPGCSDVLSLWSITNYQVAAGLGFKEAVKTHEENQKSKVKLLIFFPHGMDLTLSSTLLCPSVWICTFGRHWEYPPWLIHAQNFVIVVSSLLTIFL